LIAVVSGTHSGAIAGCARDAMTGMDLSDVWVAVRGIDTLMTSTNSDGSYIIRKVAAGTYDIFSSKPFYYRTDILRVRVAPDSVSEVRFDLINVAIPERPIPVAWIKDSSSMQSLETFDKHPTVHCRRN